MSTSSDLLRAILVDPFDDTARLVYADTLEELGDVRRAAYVRLQMAAAGMPDCPGRPASGYLAPPYVHVPCEARKACRFCGTCSQAQSLLSDRPVRRRRFFDELFGAHDNWTEVVRADVLNFMGLSDWPDRPIPPYVLRSLVGVVGWRRPFLLVWRGLVCAAHMTLEAFNEQAAELFNRHPVTWVSLIDRQPLELPTHYRNQYVRPQVLYRYDHSVHTDVSPAALPRWCWGDNARDAAASFLAESDANAWLSLCAVNRGRALAGLPPLSATYRPARAQVLCHR